ncbi:MAG: RNA polymerase sigma-70 factor [Balneolales bacterium]
MICTNTNERDLKWVEQIRDGNKSAFTNLFSTYHVPLERYAFRLINKHDQIEDIVQDIFFWIWDHREKWEPRVSVKAYLYRAVHNKILTSLKKKRFECNLEASLFDPQQLSQIDEIHSKEINRAIIDAINLLPERRRRILVLSLFHELTYNEIADTLSITVNTVDTQKRRALKLLRTRLKPYITSYMPECYDYHY